MTCFEICWGEHYPITQVDFLHGFNLFLKSFDYLLPRWTYPARYKGLYTMTPYHIVLIWFTYKFNLSFISYIVPSRMYSQKPLPRVELYYKQRFMGISTFMDFPALVELRVEAAGGWGGGQWGSGGNFWGFEEYCIVFEQKRVIEGGFEPPMALRMYWWRFT